MRLEWSIRLGLTRADNSRTNKTRENAITSAFSDISDDKSQLQIENTDRTKFALACVDAWRLSQYSYLSCRSLLLFMFSFLFARDIPKYGFYLISIKSRIFSLKF